MLYGGLVGALLGGAATLAESTLRALGRSTRWSWILALCGTLVLPFWTLRARTVPVLEGSAQASAVGRAAPPAAHPRLSDVRWRIVPARFDPPLRLVWAVLSLGVVAAGALGLARMRRARRRWSHAVVDGREVLVSDDVGPLVLGLARPQVVLPRWTLDLAVDERALILDHEDEHRRARDPLVLALGALAVAAAPWNPALWWHARRLRAAVEMDCDRRVVRRGADPVGYGGLLLRVATRHGGPTAPLAAALGEEGGSILERRLTMITTEVRGGWRRALSAGVAAAALVALACETPRPGPTEPVTAAQALEQPNTAAATEGALIVLDGVEQPWRQPGDKQALIAKLRSAGVDVSEIRRIEVIKGNAARSVYGEKGRVGVIQIYTKGAERAVTDVRVVPAERQSVARSVKLIVDGRELAEHEAKLDLRGPGEAYIVAGAGSVRVRHIDVLAGAAAARYGWEGGKVVLVTTK